MAPGSFRFDRFTLDPHDRQLTCDGVPVELNARYLDALALMVSEPGKLVSKDRFLDEVWHGVPVTDEALTQCIRTLRRQLGDDATKPRYIETVVKHGYRFIAPVEALNGAAVGAAFGAEAPVVIAAPASPWPAFFRLGGAGTLGAGLAGTLGGLLYGFAASPPADAGTGAASILLVVVCLTALMATLGGAGVSFGMAAARLLPGHRSWWSVLGGAIGGMLIGALVKLLGLDAFNLLFGQTPGNITGGPEGALLGAAVGLGLWLGQRFAGPESFRRVVALTALSGAAAGITIGAVGGHMMAGSLVLLGDRFTQSRLHLDQIGRLFGESGFGPVSQIATAGLECALFSACVAGAMRLAAPARE